MVRLYSVPANAFTGEEEDDAEAIKEADDDSENWDFDSLGIWC